MTIPLIVAAIKESLGWRSTTKNFLWKVSWKQGEDNSSVLLEDWIVF